MWTLKRAFTSIFVAVLFVAVLPMIWPKHETAQGQTSPAPSINQNGNCNVAGTISGPVDQNCPTINEAPPPIPGGLYQSGQLVGAVQAAEVSPDGTTIKFTNLHISSGTIDVKSPLNFQNFTVECPDVANSGQGMAQTTIAFVGTIVCTIDH